MRQMLVLENDATDEVLDAWTLKPTPEPGQVVLVSIKDSKITGMIYL